MLTQLELEDFIYARLNEETISNRVMDIMKFYAFMGDNDKQTVYAYSAGWLAGMVAILHRENENG